jgi:hypothetical protein
MYNLMTKFALCFMVVSKPVGGAYSQMWGQMKACPTPRLTPQIHDIWHPHEQALLTI